MGHGTLLVSIPKAGTHLVASALVKCGYLEYGAGAVTTADVRRDLVARLLAREPFCSLQRDFWYLKPDKLLLFVSVETMARVLPPSAAATMEFRPEEEVPKFAAAMKRLDNAELFPQDVVLSVHELRHGEHGNRFLNDWMKTGHPRLIFNYRDPRDQLLSMVHFLRDSPVAGQRGELYGPILRGLPTLADQIAYAITCPTFPYRNVYRTNAWMLRHPDVLSLRFEDLVGAHGGGRAEAQREALRSLGNFLGFDVDADALAAELHGGTRTFRAGRQGGWEDVFSDCHRRAFEREFGDVLAMYGYA